MYLVLLTLYLHNDYDSTMVCLTSKILELLCTGDLIYVGLFINLCSEIKKYFTLDS